MIGKCEKCGREFTEKDFENASNGDPSPVGDWDFVCYPCQFELMDLGEWEDFRDRYRG